MIQHNITLKTLILKRQSWQLHAKVWPPLCKHTHAFGNGVKTAQFTPHLSAWLVSKTALDYPDIVLHTKYVRHQVLGLRRPSCNSLWYCHQKVYRICLVSFCIKNNNSNKFTISSLMNVKICWLLFISSKQSWILLGCCLDKKRQKKNILTSGQFLRDIFKKNRQSTELTQMHLTY